MEYLDQLLPQYKDLIIQVRTHDLDKIQSLLTDNIKLNWHRTLLVVDDRARRAYIPFDIQEVLKSLSISRTGLSRERNKLIRKQLLLDPRSTQGRMNISKRCVLLMDKLELSAFERQSIKNLLDIDTHIDRINLQEHVIVASALHKFDPEEFSLADLARMFHYSCNIDQSRIYKLLYRTVQKK
ncbi:MAG: hypothetical protein INQ03_09025 [Candidatus Heimdallarchaeota archaeon]|nr:hypothetical protein [Candidatus Heimdallarchaeota archaeon]